MEKSTRSSGGIIAPGRFHVKADADEMRIKI